MCLRSWLLALPGIGRGLLLQMLLLTLVSASSKMGAVFQVGGEHWSSHFDTATGLFYYYNAEKNVTQWNDPRIAFRKHNMTAEEKAKVQAMTWTLWIAPLTVLAGIVGLRLWYLMRYHPETLNFQFRKEKKKKPKMPKASKFRQRFKISQDGKGGRSANS